MNILTAQNQEASYALATSFAKKSKKLLYIGESCHSDQRWKGTHDTKRYIDKYIALHRQHQLSPTVNIAFWFDAPVERKARQQLELALILKWRSPFNKECWKWWGQPFG